MDKCFKNVCFLILLSLSYLFSSVSFSADVGYVTDILHLGLYQTPSSKAKSFKTVISGTKLQILERQGRFIKVRTPSGVLGWAKSAYVLEKIPARAILPILEVQHQALKDKHSALSAEIITFQQEKQRQRNLLVKSGAALTSAESRSQQLAHENLQLQSELLLQKNTVPLNWMLLSTISALLIGIGISYFVIDRKIRKRYGGYRID